MSVANYQLSVIIVSYNVRHFLEQTLLSVLRASAGLDVEIIVVDNHSADDSVEMVRQQFGNCVRLVANTQNTGFSVANNQGIALARGRYALLLNPDTVLQEDCLQKTLDFMEAHPEAGAVGVRMLDGKGNFLPESKRGLPTPWVAFCKMVGLSTFFPHSRTFNHYYLGHLSADAIHRIEILSGAFMFIRREALDKAGWFDEAFFMYGEDIDLSYRLLQAGYHNYYLPHTRIIHYKGESTKRGSLNYVRVFYQAMIIFAQKHFKGQRASLYIWLIQVAIYFRAMLALFERLTVRFALPLVDAVLLYAGMFWIKIFWQSYVKTAVHMRYAIEYMLINVPIYVVLWLLAAYFSGGYDPPHFRIGRLARGLFIGTIVIAAVYGFLPETLRFSRGMIVMGMVWAIFSTACLRLLIHFVKHGTFSTEEPQKRKLALVGTPSECSRVAALLHKMNLHAELVGYVSTLDAAETDKEDTSLFDPQKIGHWNYLPQLAQVYGLHEIIFCGKDLSNQEIISFIDHYPSAFDYKIALPESPIIIGSNSKNTAGDIYSVDSRFDIASPHQKRNKRVFDLFICLLLLLFSPYFWAKKAFLTTNSSSSSNTNLSQSAWSKLSAKNWLRVFWGTHSWVGYTPLPDHTTVPDNMPRLPKIKPAIFSPTDSLPQGTKNLNVLCHLNLEYAKDYQAARDGAIMLRCFRTNNEISQ